MKEGKENWNMNFAHVINNISNNYVKLQTVEFHLMTNALVIDNLLRGKKKKKGKMLHM